MAKAGISERVELRMSRSLAAVMDDGDVPSSKLSRENAIKSGGISFRTVSFLGAYGTMQTQFSPRFGVKWQYSILLMVTYKIFDFV